MARSPTPRTPRRTDKSMDPSTPSLWYQGMAEDWSLISTVLGGTKTMRKAGRGLLPQHEGEADLRYKSRLLSSVFTNYTELTLEYWIGKPFTKAVVLTKDSDEDIKGLTDDMNLCGDDLTVVLKDWFRKGMEKQVAYCLVEFPAVPEKEDGTPLTLAEEKALGLRPYWVIIPAEAVISFRKERINGQDLPVHVRYYDNEIIVNGYEESIRSRIIELNRQIDPEGKSFVERKVHTLADRKWTVTGTRKITQDFIPLVEFNTGKPELLGLCYLNVAHWQSSSDQRNCLTTARFPILAAAGVDKDTVITIGPYAFLSAKDSAARFYYVEHAGTALGNGQKDIDGLIEDMSLYGAEMLKQRPDRETATSRVLDQAESMAPLQIIVFSFKSCVELALYYTALWMGKPEDTVAKIEINTDFAMSKEQSAIVENLKELRKSGEISHEQFIDGLIEQKALPASFNKDENVKQLKRELEEKSDQAASDAKKLAAAIPQPKPPASAGGQPK